MLPHKQIETRLQQAVRAVVPDAKVTDVLVRPCPDPQFGDYQSNALMSLAKLRKMNPRQLATNVLSSLNVTDLCESVEIAGSGFLNFRLKTSALIEALKTAAVGKHLFFDSVAKPRTIVLDFSSPNVAKPMHVGHIRSTGIGDALQRVFRLLGQRVISDNHVGDWGTQFGMLILGWKTLLDRAALQRDPVAEMDRIYKTISPQCDDKEPTYVAGTHQAAQRELVKLQAGDPENSAIWKDMIRLSEKQFDEIYGRLGVKFDHTLGESFYNPQLDSLVVDLRERGVAKESMGATVVFSDGSLPQKEDPFLVNKDGEWVADPAIIRKRDGAFNYMTTDLATLDYRMQAWTPQEIVYVVDDRQSLHFKKLFLIFSRWQPELVKRVKLVHVGFGKILGDDNKPFKTRSGDTVKLNELLNEAAARALELVKAKQLERPEEERLSEEALPEVARVVGVAAVKYADLLPNRQTDYVFSWEKMLALNGNTAPYLLYAYARIRSIFRKGDVAFDTKFLGVSINLELQLQLSAKEELTLAKHLLNFGITLEAAAADYRPNYLCNYLFELAGHFTRFYENCPVLKSEGVTRVTRLLLCDLTGKVLKQGLDVLGIETLEQM